LLLIDKPILLIIRHVYGEFLSSTRSLTIDEVEKTSGRTREIDACSVLGTCMIRMFRVDGFTDMQIKCRMTDVLLFYWIIKTESTVRIVQCHLTCFSILRNIISTRTKWITSWTTIL